MKSRYKLFLFLFLWVVLFFIRVADAESFASNIKYSVCFTPGKVDCTRSVTGFIAGAKKSIEVQAYAFTSRAIAKALVAAQKRGVVVRIIIDAGELQPESHSRVRYLLAHHIPLWQDNTVNIAHNKVIIVDGNAVETGSFNYTYSAGHFNAENVLIIYSNPLAQQYLRNWSSRQKKSVPVLRDTVG